PKVYGCATAIDLASWWTLYDGPMNATDFDYMKYVQWLRGIKWTLELAAKWQAFYNDSERILITGTGGNLQFDAIYIPKYKDFDSADCKNSKSLNVRNRRSTINKTECRYNNSVQHFQTNSILFTMILCIIHYFKS
ncbi:unnamed protein product, partial [Didymodactylos carnosus]